MTDTDGEVRYDPEHKPGLSNLLELFAAATDDTPQAMAARYERYGDLKADLAEAIIELLRSGARAPAPSSRRTPSAIQDVLDAGAGQAHEVASATYARAADAMGLLPPFNSAERTSQCGSTRGSAVADR